MTKAQVEQGDKHNEKYLVGITILLASTAQINLFFPLVRGRESTDEAKLWVSHINTKSEHC